MKKYHNLTESLEKLVDTTESAPVSDKDLYWVYWFDAVGDSSRANQDALSNLSLVINTNIGWIANANEMRIVLAHGVSESGECDVFCIPVNCITKIVPVKQAKTKKVTKKHVVAKE